MSTTGRKKHVETMPKGSHQDPGPMTEKQRHRQEAGNRLQKARVLAGYGTAVEAAKAVGVNDRSYAQYENGKRGFGSKVTLFASAFNVRPEWLLTGEEPASETGAPKDQGPAPLAQTPLAADTPDTSDSPSQIFEIFAKKLGNETLSEYSESDLISVSFAAAAEFDKMALGGKGSLKEVIKVAEEIYKIAQMKAYQSKKPG